MKVETLTNSELSVLSHFAEGRSPSEIRATLNISPNALYAHVHNIKVKTGLSNLRNPAACDAYTSAYRQHGDTPFNISPDQRRIVALWLDGYTNAEIARIMELSKSKIALLLRQGISNLGTLGIRGQKRKEAIRYALNRYNHTISARKHMDDPAFN